MLVLAVVIAVSLAFAIICHHMAQKRNRNPQLWGLLGFLLGPIAMLMLALLGGRHKAVYPS